MTSNPRRDILRWPRFDGIDPDEFKRLADEKRKLEEAQQVKAGEVEKVVENRVKGIKADYEAHGDRLPSRASKTRAAPEGA